MANECRRLTIEEVLSVMRAFNGRNANRDRCWFMIGVNCGFRISELLSLKIGDVLDDSGRIVDRVTIARRHMKGKRKSRSALMNSVVKKVLSEWLEEMAVCGWIDKDDPLFPTYNGKPLDRRGAWRILTNIKKRLSLGGVVATHSMRKTFGDEAHETLKKRVAKGELLDPLIETQKLLGHASPVSTIRYLKLDQEIGDEIVRNLNIGVEA